MLDVGCTTGDLVFRMAPHAEEVVGIELSPAMAEYANQRRSDDGAVGTRRCKIGYEDIPRAATGQTASTRSFRTAYMRS